MPVIDLIVTANLARIKLTLQNGVSNRASLFGNDNVHLITLLQHVFLRKYINRPVQFLQNTMSMWTDEQLSPLK